MRKLRLALLAAVGIAAFAFVGAAGAYTNSVSYKGQGIHYDGSAYVLNDEFCTVAGGADVDGPYMLFVLTATGAQNAEITFTGANVGTFTMTKTSNGSFKYIAPWLDPVKLGSGAITVSATYDGKAKNAQLVISHGCRPVNNHPSWCSPGFWKNSHDAAWALTGISKTALFNSTIYNSFYGALATTTVNGKGGPVVSLADPVLANGTDGVLDKGATFYGGAVAGADPRTDPAQGGIALNPFNATGAFLTDHIAPNPVTGMTFSYDPAVYAAAVASGVEGTYDCPIDNHGNYKDIPTS
jgi:hypothetical protein